jgi:predicted RNA-binding protein YlqC (UPF0109 family)
MNNSIDQQFVEFVVKSLVGNPDAVQVERRIDEKGVLLELTVDPEDLGRVIGKRGATAQSLRTLLRALGTKNDARYNLKIIDNGVGEHGHHEDEGSSDYSAPVASDDDTAALATDDDDAQTDTISATSVSREDLADLADDDLSEKKEETRGSDALSKTRQELAELDDLDV